MALTDDIDNIREEFSEAIESARDDLEALESLRIKYLGKKGKVQQLFSLIGQADPDERPKIGKLVNDLKDEVTSKLEAAKEAAETAREEEAADIDVTLPGHQPFVGHNHPLSLTIREMSEIFNSMGFITMEGPEVETDYYNFEALNIPKDHPARDMQDTFYLDDEVVLRTHTSPVQVRVMEKYDPPVRIIVPGRTYRNEAVSARSNCLFYQVEGLYVDEGVTFADLKGTLEEFVHRFFSASATVRFRPSFFPFTEPSVEMDISCFICGGSGCRLCKNEGWLEILGAGMVDPNVYRYVGYDAEKYTGFAFGIGVDRIALMKYGINDIRLLYESDLRLLRQF
ncbi:MAG: phenylalanine--tRNA ligase subunit alpha [Candidatus Marinimicrobia bacterium]|nr:phenylalanine--tRNA ligase subunit alpha [Candidatus Neomarinimicrobiota bacterium]MCF7828272.1 phenylalanine--tRNA ligase subunit alpha [Candidatus Neomarinimicrobiota bacterium]MCF7879553.1 phenylalanine--tRNA ligase subunit alpha [Candidatus Neomarinimicrobiota bacterium]